MTVDLDEETQQLIEREIRSGHFRDARELVGAAIRHMLITRDDLGYTRDEIDALIAQSIASLERGEGSDGEKFFKNLERTEREKRLRPSAEARLKRG
jgi:Arc/MetJ-type ribon-helix-helix transcriptional regulator